ncbi:MAG: NAD-dependent deacylase [candidate division Zixibacteria bacterium]|nr:NAD-dependent deacylase [candidate division Zixibacteria bacterium]
MTDIPEQLIEHLRSAAKVVVSTGAGVSAESGVPTFRGKDGIWNKMSPQELASVDGFMANPELVWDWYQYRRELMNKVEPNPGHEAICKMERLFDNFVLITQNVDNLHQRAGSSNIIELHGNATRNKCFSCNELFEGDINLKDKLPHCHCGGMIRPDVVWFGEMLPERAIQNAIKSAEEAEVFFSVGTSAMVQPAASLPLIARQAGAFVVEINIESTSLTNIADIFLQGLSGEVLPHLIAELT